MNTREIAVEYRLTHWAQIMQERMASGKSVREFCASAGYKEHVFYYWQKRLREAACQELIPAMTRDMQHGASVPHGWVACVKPEPNGTVPITIEIGQYRVLVSGGMDTEQLAIVCKTLASIC
jgi:hypothetical protein